MSKDTATIIGKLLQAITFIFIILKLDGTITWSWWWVTAPTWSVFALILILATIQSIVNIICKGEEE
jgi:hypothetical protein